jgi:hypothetical protein
MRRFVLQRKQDETGISGVGRVVEGVEFSTGDVVTQWTRPPFSLGIYKSIEAVLMVHGHNGQTEVVWLDHA